MDRYKLAQEAKIASKEDLRAFVFEILSNEGIDPSIVNFKEEGVTIEALNKFVKATYNLGYRDGLEQYSTIRGKKRELDKTGELLRYHSRVAENFANKNQINKII